MNDKIHNSADFEEKSTGPPSYQEGETSQDHGLGPGLQRRLHNRHAQMITIGGVIGTGLFLGTAGSLASGGPGGLFLGYTAMSTVCVGVLLSLCELVAFLPVPGGQITLATRFVDPALGFAMGWNYWYAGAIALPAEIAAATVLINYWNDTVNDAVWITVCLIVAVLINLFGTRAYGECEFWFASLKVITIIGLIILGLVIDLGGAPDRDRRGFRYWHHPGAFTQFLGISGAKGRFLAFWSTLIQAGYAFIGTEIIGLTAAEMHNPRKNIPRAIKGVYARILIFYILGVFILGLICPSDNEKLVIGTGTAASSAWVIAINIAGIKALPSIINACILVSAWSSGSAFLYASSRVLFALAKQGHAPLFLAKTNHLGTPWISVLVCSAFGLLGYMAVATSSATVFGWFFNLSTISGMLNWLGICITFIRFQKGFKAQGLSTTILPFKSSLQPYAAYWASIWIVIMVLFADWKVFLHGQWDHASFITNYFGIVFFLGLYLGFKVLKRTKPVPVAEMDFVTHTSQG